MNPAVTLTFLQLDRISIPDAIWYIIAQFFGGIMAIFMVEAILFQYLSFPTVNYVVTIPGPEGVSFALVLETLLSFILFFVVLIK